MMKRISKGLLAIVVPAYWQTLSRGVVPGVEHGAAFTGLEFGTVLDVGANKGQFAAFARHRWPGARVICFEPLPGPRARLAKVLRGSAEVHPVALGETERQAEMHLASREDSSSLLPLGEAQKRYFDMDEERVVSVPVRRLDTVVRADELLRPVLLKIDVQGFEFETLQGGSGLLEFVDAVYVECSFVELYVGQKLAADVADYLRDYGLTETGRFNICRKGPQDVQADLLFQRAAR
ncbi:MAG: FkbM family methyltransferase [Mycobacterium sp.]|nr:FkbM family methyltransferase [Mycobacterium sp.]